MKLVHSRNVDTALIYPNPRGWPHRQSLAGLSSSILKKKLDRTSGHDSVADAKTALELALLKFQKGPGFGAAGGEPVPLGRLLRSAGVGMSLIDGANVPTGSRSTRWHLEACSEATSSSSPAKTNGSGDDTGGDTVGGGSNAGGEGGDKPSSKEEAQLKPARSILFEVLRDFESLCHDEALTGEAISSCLSSLDRRVKTLAESLKEKDMLVLLNGCGDLHALQHLPPKSADVEKAPAPEEKRRARAVKDNFKDAYGVFMAGGEKLETMLKAAAATTAQIKAEALHSQRELVNYDI
eukprot:TRINITY_DN12804_c0_g1_i4.p1 TRINITY_DN12804_c0_g1~~TRINITY_DN12804_c0_g1_i4.p1  ORF type:complete len:295 (-),score=68.97 TRINITY_DN12804_c0_g1_i4:246-1130(-)